MRSAENDEEEHEEHHSVGFTLTLHEMTPESFDKDKQDHFASDMAANLGVDPSQVHVLLHVHG